MTDLMARMAARRKQLEEAEETGEGMYFRGPNSGGGVNRNSAPSATKPSQPSSFRPNQASHDTSAKAPGQGAPATLATADAKNTNDRFKTHQNGANGTKLGDVNTSIIEQEDDDDEDEDGGISAIAKYQEELRNKDLQEQMSQYQADLKNKDAADAVVGLACGNLEEVAHITRATVPLSCIRIHALFVHVCIHDAVYASLEIH
jgi:hypothetical protein